jgi:leukotriene-A4 hydrolase
MTQHAVRVHDVTSLSNHEAIVATHIALAWTVDFAAQVIRGSATTTLTCLADAASTVSFDCKGLAISAVALVKADQTETPLQYAASAQAHEALGEGLVVQLPAAAQKGDVVSIKVSYSTSKDCTALCWLGKEQTESGTLPFVYSQCQAIHCRTMLPCQDTPAARATYSAAVTTTEPAASVVMSAIPDDAAAESTFGFKQNVAIASYLIAIAAGSIASRDVSPRCRVYAEPTMVDRAAHEFAEVEQFLVAAEEVAGPYQWGRYDMLVLPPSFPYGGMENPNLTFVTPTIVSGDRGQVDVVAHEICHSWSGNLVGIASWSDFWLNEGFTMVLQRKVTAKVHGDTMTDFGTMTGWMALKESVNGFGVDHPFTALRPTLSFGTDPDDTFSSVPYEKGFCFLKRLEALVGVAAFEAWLKTYFADFAHRSISSEEMRDHFVAAFPAEGATVDWAAAWSAVGMPTEMPPFDRGCADGINAAAATVATCDVLPDAIATDGWTGTHHHAFLEQVLARSTRPVPPAVLVSLDQRYGYNGDRVVNSEVKWAWFLLALNSQPAGYTAHDAGLRVFLSKVGRMKYVRPLFRAWATVALEPAVAFFAGVERSYNGITSKMVRRDLLAAGGKL